MSEQDEGLWYEIALTNRQVLLVFFVTLAALVGAFLSGVWFGRQTDAPTAVNASVDESLEGGGDPFEFFGEDGERDNAGAAEPASQPASQPSTPARATTSVPAPAPATSTTTTAPAAQPAASPPAATASASDDASTGPWIIQVFSSQDAPQAESVVDRLRGGGFNAFLSPVEVDGRTMYRVRVGPFDERDVADREATRIRQGYRLDTWITARTP